MSLKPTTQLISWLVIWIALVLLSSPLMAEETDQRSSTSISFEVNDGLDEITKDEQLKQADADVMTPLIKDGYRSESTVVGVHIESAGAGDVYVYDASAELISDLNYDGFYHRFSIALDVDTVYDTSTVYAKLYLSLEGGPWNHYATSENYHIYGNSESDIFVIETELGNGFPPGYYDIKVDLYDAYTGQWLANYGPYEDASLSALPLEDSYYDDSYDGGIYPIETEIVVSRHAGSVNRVLLLLIPFVIAVRRFDAG
jgi:hypothetical protein